MEDLQRRLLDSPKEPLKNLSTSTAPSSPGIYCLWHGSSFLYVGIARVDPTETTNTQAAGVAGRLNTYRRCRLTSDFAIACAFRFVVPELTADQRQALSDGRLSVRDVQALVRNWVSENVDFTAVAVDAATAVAAEKAIRMTGLLNAGRPAFNPL